MRRLTLVMLWLYPAAWRKRYREELEALIEDSGSGWRVIGDLLKESLKMQLTTWSFGKLAAVLGLAGLIVAAVGSAFLPPIYTSQAELRIAPTQGLANQNRRVSEHVLQMENEILSRTSLAGIIQDPRLDLYSSDRESMPLEDVIEKMRARDIQIRLDSPSTFTIEFHYPDKQKAHDTVQKLINRFQDANLRQGRAGVYDGEPILEVLDPPSVPQGTRIPFLPLDWEDVAPGWLRPDYVSQAELRMTGALGTEKQALELIRKETETVLSQSSLERIIGDPRLNLNESVDKMREDTQVGLVSTSTPAFTISFRYPDKLKAQRTVQVLIDKFQDANPANQHYREGPPPIRKELMNLEVLAAPSLPIRPAKPNRYLITGLGLAIGIILAALTRLLLKLRTPLAV